MVPDRVLERDHRLLDVLARRRVALRGAQGLEELLVLGDDRSAAAVVPVTSLPSASFMER